MKYSICRIIKINSITQADQGSTDWSICKPSHPTNLHRPPASLWSSTYLNSNFAMIDHSSTKLPACRDYYTQCPRMIPQWSYNQSQWKHTVSSRAGSCIRQSLLLHSSHHTDTPKLQTLCFHFRWEKVYRFRICSAWSHPKSRSYLSLTRLWLP